jgi:hypothetical protein
MLGQDFRRSRAREMTRAQGLVYRSRREVATIRYPIGRRALLLAAAASVLGHAPAAFAADDTFTARQVELAAFALARTLPATVSEARVKQLATVAALFGKDQKQKALSVWKQFVTAPSSAQYNETDWEFLQRWAAREAHLRKHAELDTVAFETGRHLELAKALASHRAKLLALAAKSQPTVTIDILRIAGDKLVKKGTRSVNRSQLTAEIRTLDSAAEEVRRKRRSRSSWRW